jgi:hypothetical protein
MVRPPFRGNSEISPNPSFQRGELITSPFEKGGMRGIFSHNPRLCGEYSAKVKRKGSVWWRKI